MKNLKNKVISLGFVALLFTLLLANLIVPDTEQEKVSQELQGTVLFILIRDWSKVEEMILKALDMFFFIS